MKSWIEHDGRTNRYGIGIEKDGVRVTISDLPYELLVVELDSLLEQADTLYDVHKSLTSKVINDE